MLIVLEREYKTSLSEMNTEMYRWKLRFASNVVFTQRAQRNRGAKILGHRWTQMNADEPVETGILFSLSWLYEKVCISIAEYSKPTWFRTTGKSFKEYSTGNEQDRY
jgi:hypothetical protein